MKNALFVVIAAVGFVGCGEESSPPGGGSVAGEGEGEGAACKGDATDGCVAGEGEGSQAEGEGSSEGEGNTGEGEGAVAGEGEGAPEECPQIFAGTTWWAEFTDVRRTDGQEYDFGAGDPNWPFWMAQEITFEQDGCTIQGPRRQFLLGGGNGSGGKVEPPNNFSYERMWNIGDNQTHPLRSNGQTSADGKTVEGSCAGEYPGQPGTTELFNITCAFTLTRRE